MSTMSKHKEEYVFPMDMDRIGYYQSGMTKREFIATNVVAQLAQGMKQTDSPTTIADSAVIIADALILRLKG